jgi:hypothetical protein
MNIFYKLLKEAGTPEGYKESRFVEYVYDLLINDNILKGNSGKDKLYPERKKVEEFLKNLKDNNEVSLKSLQNAYPNTDKNLQEILGSYYNDDKMQEQFALLKGEKFQPTRISKAPSYVNR